MFCCFGLTCRLIAIQDDLYCTVCFWQSVALSPKPALANAGDAAMPEKPLGILAQSSDISVLHPVINWYGEWNDGHVSLDVLRGGKGACVYDRR